MSDSTDGKQLENGTQGSQPEGSIDNNGQQSSNASTDTAVQIQALQRQVEALTRSLQSGKDKAVAKTNQRLDGLERDLKTVLQTAAQRGQSVQDVLGEIEADEERESREAIMEMARAFKSGQLPGSQAGGTAKQTGVDVSNVVKELELDENDMRVKAFRAQSFSSEAEAYKAGAQLVKTISTKQPSDADQQSIQGRGVVNATKIEQLQNEYNERSKNLRGQALLNLKREMRQKGLVTLY